MHSLMMFFLTCGIPFFSDQGNEQSSLLHNQSNSYFARSQVDSADFWRCPGCGLKYPHSTKTCLNQGCSRNRQKR